MLGAGDAELTAEPLLCRTRAPLSPSEGPGLGT